MLVRLENRNNCSGQDCLSENDCCLCEGNGYEMLKIKDGEYLMNGCQLFGSDIEVKSAFNDLSLLLRNASRYGNRTPQEALQMLQAIRNACDDIAEMAQRVIEAGTV